METNWLFPGKYYKISVLIKDLNDEVVDLSTLDELIIKVVSITDKVLKECKMTLDEIVIDDPATGIGYIELLGFETAKAVLNTQYIIETKYIIGKFEMPGKSLWGQFTKMTTKDEH